MRKILIAIAAAMCSWPAFADQPIQVSADAIHGTPHTRVERTLGGDVWSLEWYWDDQRRLLMIYLIKALRPANRELPPETMAGMTGVILQDGPGDTADIRKESDGTLEIWGGKADWILGSGFASNVPVFATAEERQKATRGPERNYCVSFRWLSGNRQRAMAGTYCKVLAVGETTTGEAMLTALGLQFD